MKVIILAAGKGTRMKSNLPKVLTPFAGSTLIDHALDHVFDAGIDDKPIVVVGHEAGTVKKHLKSRNVEFVHQDQQLGTGHAVSVCEQTVDKNEPVMVLYGDHAMLQPDTIQRLAAAFEKSPNKIAITSYTVPHFDVFEGVFQRYGRIMRDEDENMYAIREAKDASPEELNLREVNPAYYVFDGPWLWENLKRLSKNNAQGEYYLTELLQMACKAGEAVETVFEDDLIQAIGVNTPEQLAFAEKIYTDKK
jgi:UDP-N-acetylglucosamine diphosphorylase/glucosamine-1-phosphate N-acetyltransferase